MGEIVEVMDTILDEKLFSTTEVCEASGASYRQLDYWARIGLLVPERPAHGSGSARGYTAAQVAAARALRRWSDITTESGTLEDARGIVRDAVLRGDGDLPIRLAPGIYVVPGEISAA